MKGLFVTGTDTGVGKTIVTGCLAKYLSERGYKVITQKWIQTGYAPDAFCDIEQHLKFLGQDKKALKEYLAHICPYVYNQACSPHLASRIEKKRISAHKIIKSFKLLSSKFDFVIVEGIGGALVPFSHRHLVIEIVKGLRLPVLLVVGNRLGAINHSLLSIEAFNLRRIRLLGLIFNNLREQDSYILEDNPKIISSLTKQKVLGVLRRQDTYQRVYKEFIPIGNKILKLL